MNLRHTTLLTIAICISLVSTAQKRNWATAADSAQQALTTQFWSTEEKYYKHNNDNNTGFDYWWNAHALDVLVDGYIRTKDAAYTARMKGLLTGMHKKNGDKWENNYYDDMEWLAIACIRAYEATKDITFKNLAQELWTMIKTGWSDVHGGGLMWAKDHPNSKNSCANGPAIIIAARLYKLNKNADDLAWAKKIYNWQLATLIDTTRSLAYDNFDNRKESAMYTYNQGTWLGGALELFTITRDKQYLQAAIRNANYVIHDTIRFSPNGILKGENSGDGGLFKGIFIRYFVQLIQQGRLNNYTKSLYLKYLRANGESLLTRATLRPEYLFGTNWVTMPVSPKMDCSIQLSGIMLLEALALLNAK